VTPDGTYVEIVEIRDHPWFLGCQFHPEFKSRPLAPHPLFRAFIGAACEYQKKRLSAQTGEQRSERPGEVRVVAAQQAPAARQATGDAAAAEA